MIDSFELSDFYFIKIGIAFIDSLLKTNVLLLIHTKSQTWPAVVDADGHPLRSGVE